MHSRNNVWVTTSWDDGHPLDLRVAALLERYGIAGTFYVPLRSQLPVMPAAQVRELARRFEIGGHTVNHVRLDHLSPELAREEIIGSKSRLEDLTGSPCIMFCPPGGRWRRSHLADIRAAGYLGMRTVELMSVDHPVSRAGLVMLPATIHLYRHKASVYLKNACKRRRWNNLKTYFLHAWKCDLERAAKSVLERLFQSGGVFHLWGHSWELEHSRLWGLLETVLKHLDAHREHCHFVSNGALCRKFLPDGQCAAVTSIDRVEHGRGAALTSRQEE